MKFKHLVIWCVITTCSQFSFAANYYVDVNHPDASDTNPGTETLPFATIQRGIDAAFSGDSVFVIEGDYYPDYAGLEMKRSGSLDSLIVFKALGDVKVLFPADLNKGWRWSTLYNNYLVIDGFDISGSELPIFIQGDYNQIKNCKIHDCAEDGLNLAGGSYNSFINNEIYNTGWNGIYIECRPNDGAKGNADFNTIEYNRSYNNLNHFGINIFPNTTQAQIALTGNIIRYNKIYNNEGGIYLRNFKDGFIYGNLIYNNSNNGIFLHHLDQASNQFSSNLKIYNNTLVNNTPYNSINNVSFIDVEIKNNIFVQHSHNPCIKTDHTQGMDIDYNIYHNSTSIYLIDWATELVTLTAAQGYGLELNGIESDPSLGLDYKPGTNSNATDNGVDLGTPFNYDPEGNLRGEDGFWDIGTYEGISSSISSLQIKLMLEGPYNSGMMNTSLNDSALIPLVNPYDANPWNYENGDSVSSFPADAVDWILIEFRSDLFSIKNRCIALLRNDGSITDLNGNPAMNFYNLSSDSFYVAVFHRNHLPVISSQKIFLSAAASLYDFTTGINTAYGTNALKHLGGGVYGLYAGDTNKSFIITAADKRAVNIYLNDADYLNADANMNGVVELSDKQKVIVNKMRTSYVP